MEKYILFTGVTVWIRSILKTRFERVERMSMIINTTVTSIMFIDIKMDQTIECTLN